MHCFNRVGLSGVLLVVACSNAIEQTGGQTNTETDTAVVGSTSQGSDPSGGSDATSLYDSLTGGEGPTTSAGTVGDTSATFPTSLSESGTITGTEMDTGTTGPTSQETGTTVASTDTDPGTNSDTDMDSDSSTGTDTGTTEGDTSTGEPCVPTEEVCNDLDDDCDGNIDDVDVGMDGICDCLSIALVGNEGANPSAEFQTWLEDQGTTVARINSVVLNDIDAPLTPAVLAQYDIVILDYLTRSYSAQEAADVKAWIEGGAGLMAMTGHTNAQFVADRPNSILSGMGLTYNTSKGFFVGPIMQFAMHPITEGLTSVSFYGGLFIDAVDDGVGMNQTIMTLPEGPVGVVQERLEGRVFVFGDEWVEFDSEWQNIPQIKQFWVQTLAYLGPKNSCLVPQ
jgi:hypothetical protein